MVSRVVAGTASCPDADDDPPDRRAFHPRRNPRRRAPRREVTLHELIAQLGRGLSGAARLRDVLEEVAPGYQVMWERRLHRALLKAGVRLKPQTKVVAPDGRTAYLDLGDEELRFGVEVDGFLNHMARFAADRKRTRLLAVELDWTIAQYAVEELAVSMERAVAEIVSYVRVLEARARAA